MPLTHPTLTPDRGVRDNGPQALRGSGLRLDPDIDSPQRPECCQRELASLNDVMPCLTALVGVYSIGLSESAKCAEGSAAEAGCRE